MKHLKRTLLTLVALLAVTTGAWADEQSESFTTKGSYQLVFTGEHFTITGTQNDGSDGLDVEDGNTITIQSKNNENITHVALTFNWGFRYFGKGVADPGTIEYTYANSDEGEANIKDINSTILTISSTENNGIIQISQITVYYGDPASSATAVPLTRGTGDKANEWTFDDGMPAGNVAVSVEYFPQATAAEGAVTAATDAKATTEDALVTLDASKLTGATKLMYFVNKSTDPAPDYDTEGWTDVLPTAESFTEAGGYNVYYYPLGTDDADPTKTYSDGDICAAPILVTVLPEPTYSVTFAEDTPEPDNWSAQPNTGVKKGETVTVTYSGERKVIGVKAEKKAESTLAAALKDGAIVTITYGWGSYTTILTYTNNGGTFSCNITGSFAGDFASSSTLNDKSFTLSGWHVDMKGDTKFTITFNAENDTYVFNEKGSEARSFSISLNGEDITDQLTEEK